MILHDLRYAFRILRKDLSVTAAAILILALGIGSTTLVFSLANGLLLRPLPYPQQGASSPSPNRAPRIPTRTRKFPFPTITTSVPAPAFSNIGVYVSSQSPLRGEGSAERVPSAAVSDGIFRVLGVEPLLGRYLSREDDVPNGPKVVVLSEELWQRRYGLRSAHSRQSLTDCRRAFGRHRRHAFRLPLSRTSQLWFPLQMDPAKAARTDYFLRAIARLKPGVSIEQTPVNSNLLRTNSPRKSRCQ